MRAYIQSWTAYDQTDKAEMKQLNQELKDFFENDVALLVRSKQIVSKFAEYEKKKGNLIF